MMVPAVTINPLVNLVRANSLASSSVANVSVKRGCRRLDSVPSGGTSKVTYQVCFMLRCRRCWSSVLRAGTKKAATGTKRDGFFRSRSA